MSTGFPTSAVPVIPSPFGCSGAGPRHDFRAVVCDSDGPNMVYVAVEGVTEPKSGEHGWVGLR